MRSDGYISMYRFWRRYKRAGRRDVHIEEKNLIYPNISQQQQAAIGHSEVHNLICSEIGREGNDGVEMVFGMVYQAGKWVAVTDGTSRTDVDIIHYYWPIDSYTILLSYKVKGISFLWTSSNSKFSIKDWKLMSKNWWLRCSKYYIHSINIIIFLLFQLVIYIIFIKTMDQPNHVTLYLNSFL